MPQTIAKYRQLLQKPWNERYKLLSTPWEAFVSCMHFRWTPELYSSFAASGRNTTCKDVGIVRFYWTEFWRHTINLNTTIENRQQNLVIIHDQRYQDEMKQVRIKMNAHLDTLEKKTQKNANRYRYCREKKREQR